jgi:hypothetical protein
MLEMISTYATVGLICWWLHETTATLRHEDSLAKDIANSSQSEGKTTMMTTMAIMRVWP